MKKNTLTILVLALLNVITSIVLISNKIVYKKEAIQYQANVDKYRNIITTSYDTRLEELYYEGLTINIQPFVDLEGETHDLFGNSIPCDDRVVIIINSDHCGSCYEDVFNGLAAIIDESGLTPIIISNFSNQRLFKNFSEKTGIKNNFFNSTSKDVLSKKIVHESPIFATLNFEGRISNIYISKKKNLSGIYQYFNAIKNK